jgi:putative heme iron utilization protein
MSSHNIIRKSMKKIMPFDRKTKEVDEIIEYITQIMERTCEHTVQKIELLEEAQLAASKRMDRIEAVIEANANSIKELNHAVTSMYGVASLSQKNFEVIQKNFEVIVSQVKGMQSENRHILDHLFGIQE